MHAYIHTYVLSSTRGLTSPRTFLFPVSLNDRSNDDPVHYTLRYQYTCTYMHITIWLLRISLHSETISLIKDRKGEYVFCMVLWLVAFIAAPSLDIGFLYRRWWRFHWEWIPTLSFPSLTSYTLLAPSIAWYTDLLKVNMFSSNAHLPSIPYLLVITPFPN